MDDLILAGIHKVSHLVIANNDTIKQGQEKAMVDSETVVAVETITK